MNVRHGSVWDNWPTEWVVVPTNIGWTSDGKNVMGAGVARAAKERCPGLDRTYGTMLMSMGGNAPVIPLANHSLIMFPTKPLAALAPWASWKGDSSLTLVEKSLRQLRDLGITDKVSLPMVGCGNGRLQSALVTRLMADVGLPGNFTLVIRKDTI